MPTIRWSRPRCSSSWWPPTAARAPRPRCSRSSAPTPWGTTSAGSCAAEADAELRARINRRHMLAGVTIVDPASTFIEPDVRIERDAVLHPFTVLRGATSVGEGAQVGPHVVAVDAQIGRDALVGPFCYL